MHGRPIIFGEVLFDRFPDGSSVLGGAPFNVAWHLRGFGLNPHLVSRVGDDGAGREVLARMGDWGLDTAGVQQDPERPTGAVDITLDAGQPTFTILAEQAYDYIGAQSALERLPGDGGLLYHGSLASRSAASRTTLQSLHTTTRLPVFVDINLRPPWWERESAGQLMLGARWLKVNDGELSELLGPSAQGWPLDRAAEALKRQSGAEWLIVTRGEKGAAIFGPQGRVAGEVPPVADLVDTVGAGDAFSAVAIIGFLRGWQAESTLTRALAFAAAVCRLRGAVSHDTDFYLNQANQWE